MTGLETSFASTAAIRKLQKGLISLVPDVDEVLDSAVAVILNRVRTRFLAETDPDGKKWIPSKAGLQRRATGGSGTLFDTGTLFHSIHAIRKSDYERIVTFDRSRAPYGEKHQLGKDGFPKRVFIGTNQDDADGVTKVLALALKRKTAKI